MNRAGSVHKLVPAGIDRGTPERRFEGVLGYQRLSDAAALSCFMIGSPLDMSDFAVIGHEPAMELKQR